MRDWIRVRLRVSFKVNIWCEVKQEVNLKLGHHVVRSFGRQRRGNTSVRSRKIFRVVTRQEVQPECVWLRIRVWVRINETR